MSRLTTFKFALDLSPVQEQACQRYAGAARKAWNVGLSLVKQRMDERREEISKGQFAFTQVPVSRNQLIPAFNAFKVGDHGEQDGIASWYNQVSKYCFEEALVDLSRSLSAFYERAGTSRKVGFSPHGEGVARPTRFVFGQSVMERSGSGSRTVPGG